MVDPVIMTSAAAALAAAVAGFAVRHIERRKTAEVQSALTALRTQLAESDALRRTAESRLDAAAAESTDTVLMREVFLSHLTHDLRTPLNAVLGYSQLLLDGDGLNEEQRGDVKSIHDTGKQLLDMIRSMIEVARTQAGGALALNKSRGNVGTVIDRMLERCRGPKGETWLAVRRGSDLGMIDADFERLVQAIDAVTQLAHAPPQGAETNVDMEVVREQDQEEEIIEFRVRGASLDQETVDRLLHFVAFHDAQGSFRGVATRLALARKLFRLMGGDVWVDNKPNATTFRLRLPAVTLDASTDPVTLLPYAEGALTLVQRELDRTSSGDQSLVVVVVRLSRLAELAARHGNDAAADVLRRTADGMRGASRGYDMVARLDADTFVMVCPHAPAEVVDGLSLRIQRGLATLGRDVLDAVDPVVRITSAERGELRSIPEVTGAARTVAA